MNTDTKLRFNGPAGASGEIDFEQDPGLPQTVNPSPSCRAISRPIPELASGDEHPGHGAHAPAACTAGRGRSR